MADYRIYRWQIDPKSPMDVVIPSDAPLVETLELGPNGLSMRRMLLTSDGLATTFPELEIWDDPSRSPALGRTGEGWQNEDTSAMLQSWEQERLQQFQEHCFHHYYAMQVVYRQPPMAEPVSFHQNGKEYQGWRVGMVAAFFAGFKPKGLQVYNPQDDESPVETPAATVLQLVEAPTRLETRKPESSPAEKPRLRLVPKD